MRLWGLLLFVVISFLIANVVGVVGWILVNSLPGGAGSPDSLGREVANLLSQLVEDPAGAWPLWSSAAFIALTQGMFLLPTFSPLWRSGHSRSMRSVVVGASGIAAMLSAVWVFAAFGAVWLLVRSKSLTEGWSGWTVLGVLLLQLAVLWCLWYRWLSRRAMQQDVPEAWLVRRVLSGTGLMVVGTIPLDVMVRRKSDCYCGEGTCWALVWGIGGAFWCCGPWLFLAKTRNMRRALRAVACPKCGHLRDPGGGSACPECANAYPPTPQRSPGT